MTNFSHFVELHDLGHYVPVVRVEKRARPGEFYFFVALEGPVVGEVPPIVDTKLALFPLLGTFITDKLSYDDIRGMASTELDTRMYAHRIAYHPPYISPDADPFDLAASAHDNGHLTADRAVEQTRRHNHLLFWLSAVGTGSLDLFRTTCGLLELASQPAESHRILRRLRLLGHLETSPNGTRWSASPSVVIRRTYPDSEPAFFLAGARDMHLLEALRSIAKVEEVSQRGGMGPATVHLVTDEQELLASLELLGIRWLDIGGNVAQRLANALPDLEGWVDTLTPLQGISSTLFDIKRFNGTTFVTDAFEGKSGFYQLWSPAEHARPQAHPKYTLFYDEPNGRWLRGDWYGLRFLDLRTQENFCPVRYDEATGQLAIPEQWRWPEIYERALVLASGRLPAYASGWLIYEAINSTLVETLGPKIGMEIEGDEIYA
ncbi:MAG TPA: hypothetical protein VLA19_15860 [Herpetosiphonaceae bacterium]|nr:hypothetical protein [Herpetosiphonaceae bacterium]